MKRFAFCAAIGLVLMTGMSAQAAQEIFVIPHGDVVVDGCLSEWSLFDEWHGLSEIYTGVTDDLSDARYAARWNDADNLIYVAIAGVDIDQVFVTDYAGWNQQDAVEVYFEASGLALTDNYSSQQDTAQQYVAGSDGACGAWAVLGGGLAVPTETQVAVGVVGDELVYEIAMTPYAYYAGLGGTDQAQSIRDLEPGQTVGVDVSMNTRTAAGDFGMLTNNTVGGKFHDASAIQQHVLLIPEPASLSLLALGGLAAIRRRR